MLLSYIEYLSIYFVKLTISHFKTHLHIFDDKVFNFFKKYWNVFFHFDLNRYLKIRDCIEGFLTIKSELSMYELIYLLIFVQPTLIIIMFVVYKFFWLLMQKKMWMLYKYFWKKIHYKSKLLFLLHIIFRIVAESRSLLMEHKYPPPLILIFVYFLFLCLF